MQKILRIARNEFRMLQREGRFREAAVFTLLLFVVAFATGWQNYQQSAKLRAQAAETVRTQWLNQGRRNAQSAAHYGLYTFKPLLPLAAKQLSGQCGALDSNCQWARSQCSKTSSHNEHPSNKPKPVRISSAS